MKGKVGCIRVVAPFWRGWFWFLGDFSEYSREKVDADNLDSETLEIVHTYEIGR